MRTLCALPPISVATRYSSIGGRMLRWAGSAGILLVFGCGQSAVKSRAEFPTPASPMPSPAPGCAESPGPLSADDSFGSCGFVQLSIGTQTFGTQMLAEPDGLYATASDSEDFHSRLYHFNS